MNTVETILNRRSIRKYKQDPVSEEDIRKILACGMAGPSAVNARDWSFVVVNDKEKIADWAEKSGRAGNIIKDAAFAVLVCADTSRSFKHAPEFYVINAAIAAENMILAATDLGIGSVWLGVWPQNEKIETQKAYFELPEEIIPQSIIAFGYPDEDKSGIPHKDYEEDRVHFNQW
ncbi:MAG: nitroreductase family protein [Erysipelotrichaceae bacterium]|nr:nitroreductase family protein [Erysipelotrichaceae bacterium]